MSQQQDCLVVFESITFIYRVVKLSNFYGLHLGNVINVFRKLFCTTNHESKWKPFKTNNSSPCMVCTFLMTLLWVGKDLMNALGES